MKIFHLIVLILNNKGFLINQSKEWGIAQAACFIEYFFEEWYITQTHEFNWIINIGLCIMIFGQFFRIGALVVAGSNFNHTIEISKNKNHVLVTSGVYRYFYT